MNVRFDNTYARLPPQFFARLDPPRVREPQIVRVNRGLADQLGFDADWLQSAEGAQFAVGNLVLADSDPIATVYAGHQFGGFASRLGDGRAILLGEVIDREGERFDIQLKGSGPTPFSRRGDGRSPLGPVLREYIVSEAMAALSIPTTRSLVAATTGEPVRRETMQPGGVLVRVARSHIRVGTFEYFAARQDLEALEALFDHVAARHYADLHAATPMELLRAITSRQAELIAEWMLVGFIHGVMNTDNMLVSGETIDYGPCAFMDEYDPATVYSSIDRGGRYAYGNQPPIAQWNLTQLASCLLMLTAQTPADIAEAESILNEFPARFRVAYGEGMARKLGLLEMSDEDWPLIEDLLELMFENKADYTNTFRTLSDGEPDLPEAFGSWLQRWRERVDSTPHNPAVIPRNHLVEAAISSAVEHHDFAAFHELVDAVTDPFAAPADAHMCHGPRPDERVHATFCGT